MEDHHPKDVLITGGAGFIGSNAACHYLKRGARVTCLDNLTRYGSTLNQQWLSRQPNFSFIAGDVRETDFMRRLFVENKFELVLHCAAQVAVTSSVVDPEYDHDVNVKGTLNTLEALRRGKDPRALFVFTSTNKVYGSLEQELYAEEEVRYLLQHRPRGISEDQSLDFNSPYGCSKGAADQYTRDYARTYGLNTIVFRLSCVYGPRQFGIEDQGWVAWFLRKALLGERANVYGTGKQVRDLLYIDDLLAAFELVYQHQESTCGRIYNIGGGSSSALSVLEVLAWIKTKYPTFKWEYQAWRPGDQKVYISDVTRAEREFGWQPKTLIDDGLSSIMTWAVENKKYFYSLALK